MTGFANVEVDRVSAGGGVLQASITGGTRTVRATSVPTPCRECYVFAQAGIIAFDTYCAINTSVNVSLGATIPTVKSTGREVSPAMRVPIDDVSKLWFHSPSAPGTKLINITYRF